ncbi:DNA replication checkpoint protein tel2 [Pseudocercospora fuligena]|uniref:DNA replication checkpoint protein tel2 n=1 Tax=Pseudocercospora fuligena TaxID=685502 RepID=A0A8H6R762_9PEZI|nr:DNA replication checkpoint protein tel2 [Pseudocercospora fuligena]
MTDLLTAVRSKKEGSAEQPLLTAVSTLEGGRVGDTGNEAIQVAADKAHKQDCNSPEEILQVLRSQPDLQTVAAILRRLSDHADPKDFDLAAPGPRQAQIIHALATNVIPMCFDALEQTPRRDLSACLQNLAGISALLARTRLVSESLSSSKQAVASPYELQALLQAARLVLPEKLRLDAIWSNLKKAVADTVKRQLAWKELVNLLGSGKVIATIARAEDVLQKHDQTFHITWLSKGSEYAAWLGTAILNLLDTPDTSVPAATLLSKSFSLGYNQSIVKALMMGFRNKNFSSMLADLPTHSVRQLVEALLQHLSTISTSGDGETEFGGKDVRAVSGFMSWLMDTSEAAKQAITSYLCDPALNSTISISVRAACTAAIAKDASDDLETLFETLLTSFGNHLFINHAPIIQQESLAQVLLLVAGALHRHAPMAVLMIARSSGHMQGVSDRLHASNLRARWLGMIVGTAISSLVDKEGSKMDFGTEDMQTQEARWYLGLVDIEPPVGSLDEFKQFTEMDDIGTKPKHAKKRPIPSERLPIINGKQTFGPVRPPAQTKVVGERVTELDDDSEHDDDDLKPYAKPDDDPEDSDEDATLVNRDKPRPPVYIRDLMRMLRDTEKPDRFQMGIKHAAGLIRRKLNFGGEVRDHAEELALIFCDLQDPFDTDDFDELRIQALIAILLSDIPKMAPWLSLQSFAGDYSLSQRCIMLSALGLAGRETAGLRDQDIELNPALPANDSFPSKRLTGRLHAIYDPKSPPVKRLEAASSLVEHQLIKPLALSAADKATSDLNAVKVRTFSSRLTSDNRTKRKPAPNQLAKVFATAFFYPLVSRYQQELAAYGQGSVFASTPFVQVTFLKTLALLLHASGPTTLQLPEVTTAFWELLLALRVQATSDISILEAVLFSLLTLLEINTEYGGFQHLASENPKQLMETQQWIELVFERTGGGQLVVEGSTEETRVRTLAAGVLMKCREVIEAYQSQLIGVT